MLNSAILEVIVGLIFVYSLLSILVTQINSLLSNLMNLRAKHLRDGLADLLRDPQLQAKVMSHPLINILRGSVDPLATLTAEEARAIVDGDLNKVSWVPSDTFVNVLMDTVKDEADNLIYGPMHNIIESMPSGQEKRILRALLHELQTTGKGLDNLRAAIQELHDNPYYDMLTDALTKLEIEIGELEVEKEGIGALLVGLKKVKDDAVRLAMETIIRTAESVDDARQKLEQWFDDSMSRVSEAYQRKMQLYSLVIGLLIALLVNVDTLQLARTLWEDPVLRADLVQAAEQFDQQAALDATTGATTTPDSSATEIFQAAQEDATAARQTVQQILDLRLPVGWRWQDLSDLPDDDPLRTDNSNLWNFFPANNPSHWLGLLLAKIVGCVATMIAIAQGAPFWFDLLNRLTGRGGSKSSE